MSAFARIKPAGFEPNEILTHEQMTQLDLNVSKALNAVDGGEWHPTAPITIGGEGIEIDSRVTWLDGARAHFTGKSEARFHVNSLAVFESGSDAMFETNSAATFEAGALAYFAGGSKANFNNAEARFSQGSTAIFEDTSSATFQSGAELELKSGSEATFGGTCRLKGEALVQSDGSLTAESGSTVELKEGGTYKLRDTIKTSGNGRIGKRVETKGAGSPSGFNLSRIDTLIIEGNYAATITFTDSNEGFPGDIVAVITTATTVGSAITKSTLNFPGGFSTEISHQFGGSPVRYVALYVKLGPSRWMEIAGPVAY